MIKERLKLKCAACNSPIEKLKCQIREGQKKFYCSKKCVGAGKHTGSTLFCHLCDTPFYRRAGEQKAKSGSKSENQFCSRECYQGWRYSNVKASTYRKTGAVHVHRLIAESVTGRPLKPGEVVHHIDLDKHNNNLDNLALLPNQALHARIHQGKLSIEEVRKYALNNWRTDGLPRVPAEKKPTR